MAQTFESTYPALAPAWVSADLTGASADLAGSFVPVPWRLIPVDNRFF